MDVIGRVLDTGETVLREVGLSPDAITDLVGEARFETASSRGA